MTRVLLAALLLATTGIAAAGPNPVGTWRGNLQIDDSKMTLTDPSQVSMAKHQIAAAKKLVISIIFKADKTFIGNPPPSNGTWSLSGNKVNLSVKGKSNAQTFTFSKDGKTLICNLPTNQGITSKIVLKKS